MDVLFAFRLPEPCSSIVYWPSDNVSYIFQSDINRTSLCIHQHIFYYYLKTSDKIQRASRKLNAPTVGSGYSSASASLLSRAHVHRRLIVKSIIPGIYQGHGMHLVHKTININRRQITSPTHYMLGRISIHTRYTIG